MKGLSIKFNRLKNGLSKKQLAERVFVSESTVSRWEREDAEPLFHTQKAIRQVLKPFVDNID